MTYLPFFDPPIPDPSPRIPMRVVVSPSAAVRLTVAREMLSLRAPGARVLIVGASRAAADDLAREVASSVPATFGIERLSFTQLAAKTALLVLASEGTTASTRLGAEAVATRAAFGAMRDSVLQYFAPVATTPGFPRALARTLQELRLAKIGGASLAPLPLAGPDLAILLDRFEACFTDARSVDRAGLFRTAATALRDAQKAEGRSIYDSVVLLDISLEHAAEREFVGAIVDSASAVLAAAPHGDRDTIQHLVGMGGVVEEVGHSTPSTDLACVGRYLFDPESQPPVRELDGSVEFYSAPGEGRECVEMARRVLREARMGVRFDEMAILVRAPHSYFGLLEHAMARAGVPAWFDRGTRRPHPAGRAFLALLACAADRVSAVRFAEYLSLGQVPGDGTGDKTWNEPEDEVSWRQPERADDELELEAVESRRDPADMTAFAQFALELVSPPNPLRDLDNDLSTGDQAGMDFYNGPVLSDFVRNCNGCHTLNAALGFFGSKLVAPDILLREEKGEYDALLCAGRAAS